jgi:transglutaminase-like putative cysteine protease
MLFEIVHRTDYRYGHPATEACIEARLTPPDLPWQRIRSLEITFRPEAPISNFIDHFGNTVSFYAMAARHENLSIENRILVETSARPGSSAALGVTVAEARQLSASRLADVFDYLQPTAAVPTGGGARTWASKFFPGKAILGEALDALNRAIHGHFAYRPGATEVSTPLAEVWKRKEGVCQDFAHVALSVLRTAGIPARYVCGYIESAVPGTAGLVGSTATHAWVEALLPGQTWAALDPTNRQWCGERHVSVSYGRDYDDAAPVRGTFKGSGAQRLTARVRMRRKGSTR